MTAVVRGDALAIPLADNSVDLAITSPPYFALRSYRDDGDHYDGQIGSEPTPQAFLEALWAVTRECWRVLKPSGSLFVNLGDKRAGTGGANGNTGLGFDDGDKSTKSDTRGGPRNNTKQTSNAVFNVPTGVSYRGVRAKSKMLLPHRYAIGCEDGLADPDGVGWIVRQDMVWSKPNGLPESVIDRVRDSHEYWFHLCKSPRYFAAVDEVREAQSDPHRSGPDSGSKRRLEAGENGGFGLAGEFVREYNPLGKLPGSVWSIPSEPLQVPNWLGVDHFAAFPQEWPRRLILGWSPSGICTACNEGRRPVCNVRYTVDKPGIPGGTAIAGRHNQESWGGSSMATITGYACACPHTNAPTRPAVILDPFGGTGTVAMVARALGRTGISLDLSADYCRLASWRIFHSHHAAKTTARTHRANQGSLL